MYNADNYIHQSLTGYYISKHTCIMIKDKRFCSVYANKCCNNPQANTR